MKTLADFKRAMTLGSVWQRKHIREDEYVLRTVTSVHSNHVYLSDGVQDKIYLSFPKASEFNINSEGEAEIYCPPTYTYEGLDRIEIPRKLVLTYRKVK